MKKETIKEYGMIALGSVIFAIGINLFIVPIGIYNGGVVGTAQIIRTVLVSNFGLEFNFDIAGIINFLINIPLLIISYFMLNSKFVRKTIFSVIVQTVVFSIIPTTPLVNDFFSSLLIGTIISGIGVSMILVQRATAGGTDVMGMLLIRYFPKLTIGKFTLYYNIIVYILCAFLFDVEIAVYSVLQAALFSFVVDARHLQNIDVSAMIFTRNKEVKKMIINDCHRGVTYWEGMGAYTSTETEVLVTIISKYEVPILVREVKKMDPKAFVIVSQQMNVTGNVEKRLI